MSTPDPFWDATSDQPTPTYYIALARTINAAARQTIRLDSMDGDEVGIRVSIGLSLQAAELAGKAILRSCGQDAAAIRRAHGRHGLLPLLIEAEAAAVERARVSGRQPPRFLSTPLVIDGVAFRQTIRAYLELHFANPQTSSPRGYLYPDTRGFAYPRPVQGVYVLAEQLIDVAERFAQVLVP